MHVLMIEIKQTLIVSTLKETICCFNVLTNAFGGDKVEFILILHSVKGNLNHSNPPQPFHLILLMYWLC